MRETRLLFSFLMVVVIAGCATSGPKGEDVLDVRATAWSERGSEVLYTVVVQNVSDQVLTIRGVDVESSGLNGPSRTSNSIERKRIEPGETAEFSVWSASGDVPRAMANIVISYDDASGKPFLRTYTVNVTRDNRR